MILDEEVPEPREPEVEFRSRYEGRALDRLREVGLDDHATNLGFPDQIAHAVAHIRCTSKMSEKVMPLKEIFNQCVHITWSLYYVYVAWKKFVFKT